MNTPVTLDTMLRDAVNREKVAQYWEREAVRVRTLCGGYFSERSGAAYMMHVNNARKERVACERLLNEAAELEKQQRGN